MRKSLSATVYLVTALIGLVAFSYPLFISQLQLDRRAPAGEFSALSPANTTLLTMVLVVIGLGVLFIEVQGQAVNAKVVAALGILVAVASVLRLLETAIPGPGGFSPIFVPIILAGYVYGARFGFLMGTMTLLVSALITGGVGPWLPYQMFVAGWIGLTAGWLPKPGNKKIELTMLSVFAFAWGILFGVILNLYFWPMLIGNSANSWQPDEGFLATLSRYGAFYLTTSFAWDVVRALGNLILILAIGLPVLRALNRFRDRLKFELV